MDVLEQTRSVSTSDIEEALASVRHLLQSHAGDLEVVSFDDGILTLKLCGTCTNCPAQPMTVATAIMPILEGVPGIRDVRINSLQISDAALKRIRKMFDGHLAPSLAAMPLVS